MRARIAAIMATVTVMPVLAFAQNPAPASGPSKIAMVDISRAVLSTEEGKRAMDALQKKFEPRQAQIQKQANDLQEMAKPLNDGSKLADDARATLMKSLSQKQLALQHSAEDLQADARSEQNEVVSRVLKNLAPVIDKYARENGYTMIFDAQFWPSGPVLWASGPAADITSAIIAAYNAQPAQPVPSGGGSQ